MNCEQAQRAFEELIEGGRLLHAGLDLEEHLASCAECRARYADELQAIGALETLEALPVPPDFAERVLSRLPDAPPKPQPASAPVREAPMRRVRLLWETLVGQLNWPASRR
jgi:hypothetical protein